MNKRQKEIQGVYLDNEEAVIRELKKTYRQALKDIDLKVMSLEGRISELKTRYGGKMSDSEKLILDSMVQSKVYQKNYQEALKTQLEAILDGMYIGEFRTIDEYLNACYEDGFLGALYDLQGQGIPLVYPMDQASIVRAIQTDSKISKGLYSRLGEDIAELKKAIPAEIARGISTGETFEHIAQQIAFRMSGTYNSEGGALANALRIVRTEGHRIQIQATVDSLYQARALGADVVKQWSASLDRKTRNGHIKVDNEIRELEEKFSNSLMQPGDPNGKASEVVNCRCALLERARWALERDETKMLGNVSEMPDDRKQVIADKLGIPVKELEKYSDKIVPIKAKSYEDFKAQYNKLWHYEGSELQKQAEEAIRKRKEGR